MSPQQRKSSNKKRSADEKNNSGHAEKNSPETSDSTQTSEERNEHFQFPWKRVFFRIVGVIVLTFSVWLIYEKDETLVFASQKEKLQLKSANVPCSKSYLEDISKFKGCVPKHCGRLVTDIVISPEESAHLLRLSKKGLAFGGSSGGASILDLHSGALSYKNTFVNIYEKLKLEKKKDIFTLNDFKIYSNVRTKIQQIIAYNFGIEVNKLFLTHPTFFSEMTAKPAKTAHDEYWHVHIDKETYPSFHYTSLLYLSNYKEDFTGGRFVFVGDNKNMTIEPRIGRISAFTSGAENPHYVEPVSSGVRYAITVSFTCDLKLAINDPNTKKIQ